MDPKAIIDSYVGDVVRHLPRRQRTDVARELRSLLDDELAGRAGEVARPPDSALTMELLTAFGQPRDVADRYRPAGFTIIRPSDAARFTWIAFGGIALVWAITLPALMLGITPIVGWDYGANAWWGRLTVWWLGPGLGALWWPGVMIIYALIAALVARRSESRPDAWAPASPRTIDRDRVSRVGIVFALAGGLLGATVVIAVPSLATWAPGLPQPVLDALAVDPVFLQWRAPWVLAYWAAAFALSVVVLIIGRWTPVSLRIRGALDVVLFGLLAWWILAGPVMVSAAADTMAKFLLAALAVYAAIDAGVALRRIRATAGRKPATRVG